MASYEIPLSAASQRFSVPLAGATYNMAVIWRDGPEGGWVLDISDQGNTPIVQGLPLLPGADLLAQYGYLGLGFQLWVQSDTDPNAPPTYDDLGTSSHLYAVY